MSTPGKLLTVEQTKREYGLSHSTLYRFIAAQQIEAVKIGRSTRIVRESVDRCVASLPRLHAEIAA